MQYHQPLRKSWFLKTLRNGKRGLGQPQSTLARRTRRSGRSGTPQSPPASTDLSAATIHGTCPGDCTPGGHRDGGGFSDACESRSQYIWQTSPTRCRRQIVLQSGDPPLRSKDCSGSGARQSERRRTPPSSPQVNATAHTRRFGRLKWYKRVAGQGISL